MHANYEGDPNHLFGTAPIYDLDPGAEKPAIFAFIVPTLNIPITIPVSVRTGERLRAALHRLQHHPADAAGGSEADLLGLPGARSPRRRTLPERVAGISGGLPGVDDTGCIGGPTAASIAVHPLTDNPTVCTGEPLPVTLEVQTYQDPEHLSHGEDVYPPITECENETFKPVLFAAPTTKEADSASGLDIALSDPQSLGFAATPSELRSAVVTLPDGLTINPDAADGQSACTDARPTSTPRVPPTVRTTPRSGRSRSTRSRSRARSKARSTSANRSRATSTACS